MKTKLLLIWLALSLSLSAQISNGGGVIPSSPCGDSSHAISWNGSIWGCQAITGSALAGGSSGQLQWNNATALAGISGWTSNGTTTITAGATSIFDLSASGATTGLKLPSAAGAAPTADGQVAFNTTTHLPVWGSNTATVTIPVTNAGAAHQFVSSYSAATGAFATVQPAFADIASTPTTLAGYGITNGVTSTTTVNGHALSANVTVTAGDVGNTTAQWNANQINGVTLGSLATGILKNTTTTGVPSIAGPADVDALFSGTGKCYLFKGSTPGTNDGCDTPSVASNVNNATQFSFAYYSTAGSANVISGAAPATTPASVPEYFVSTPTSGGAAQAPSLLLAGVGTNAQVGTTYTIASTDRAGYISFSNAGAIAVTLPQAGTAGFGSNFVTVACDIGAGTATITPTTSTISFSTGAAYTAGAASLPLSTGQCAWIYSNNTNYFAIVRGGAAAGVTSFTGDGTLLSNSGSNGAVTATLANAGAHKYWGNPTGSTAAPGYNSLVTADLPTSVRTRAISFTIGDPGGSALTAASTTTAYVTVPFGCTISAYNLAVDAGTITVKFWDVATGTAIPTSANSINTSGVSISTGTAIHSTTLTDFTSTTVTANDILAMNVTAVATAKFVNGVLECDQ